MNTDLASTIGCEVHGAKHPCPIELRNRGTRTLVTYQCLAPVDGRMYCHRTWVIEYDRISA